MSRWPPRIVPPKGAPNVLLIMTHDEGFGAPSTFGGVIPTPTMDRIADAGLRYTNFHSTSLCSPTRAAIITGRNHHSVGFGVVGEISTGFPGYDLIIPLEKGTIGTILKGNGYATAWFGKTTTPPPSSRAKPGPSINGRMGWASIISTGCGRRRQPVATEPVPQYDRDLSIPGKSRRRLETAMADDAIQYIKQLKEIAPGKLRFVYYVPGATHAPHHPTEEWTKKDQRHASLRRRLEQAARDHLRKPEAARHHARERPAHALAEGIARVGFPLAGTRRSSLSTSGRLWG